MTAVYLFNLVLGGILFGSGYTSGDDWFWFAGMLLIVSNLLPFIPWKD